MSTLTEKADEILAEKTSKIIPENIKSGITVFGVTGNYEGDPQFGTGIFLDNNLTCSMGKGFNDDITLNYAHIFGRYVPVSGDYYVDMYVFFSFYKNITGQYQIPYTDWWGDNRQKYKVTAKNDNNEIVFQYHIGDLVGLNNSDYSTFNVAGPFNFLAKLTVKTSSSGETLDYFKLYNNPELWATITKLDVTYES